LGGAGGNVLRVSRGFNSFVGFVDFGDRHFPQRNTAVLYLT
jgi:hypothetical protein